MNTFQKCYLERFSRVKKYFKKRIENDDCSPIKESHSIHLGTLVTQINHRT